MENKKKVREILGERIYKLLKTPSKISEYADKEVQKNEHDYLCDAYNELLSSFMW